MDANKLMIEATNVCKELFNDSTALKFTVKDNKQIVLEFSENINKDPRIIHCSVKDTNIFLNSISKNITSSTSKFANYIYNFLTVAGATRFFDWENLIREEKSFKLDIELNRDIIKNINLYLPIIFDEKYGLKLKTFNNNRIEINSNGLIRFKNNTSFHQAHISTEETSKFIGKVEYLEGDDLIIEIIRFFKVSKALKSYGWDEIIKYIPDIEFDHNLEKEAFQLLEEHNEGVNDFFLNDIRDYLDGLGDSKELFLEFWDKYISKERFVIKDLSNLDDYKVINRKIDFISNKENPVLILKSLTGSVTFTNKSHVDFLSVAVDESALTQIKNTINVIKEVLEIFDSYKIFKDRIDNHIQELLLEFSSSTYVSYKDIYDCEKELLSQSNYYFDSYDRCMILKNGYLFFDNIDFSINFIDNHFSSLKKTIKNQFNTKVQAVKNANNNAKNKDSNFFILKVVLDNPKKGMTTYTSILKGDVSSKISSYGYDKLLSYGKLSNYTKREIQSQIEILIDKNLILEKALKASFGSYTGLVISNEGNTYLSKLDVPKKEEVISLDFKIESIDEFLSSLKISDNNNRKIMLIKSLKQNKMPVNQSEIISIIDFIKECRNVYRSCEKEIIDLFGFIIPIKYKDIFLLNANLSTGVTKDTFNSIYNKLTTSYNE